MGLKPEVYILIAIPSNCFLYLRRLPFDECIYESLLLLWILLILLLSLSVLAYSSPLLAHTARKHSRTLRTLLFLVFLQLLPPHRSEAHSRLPLTLPWILTLSPGIAALSGILLYSRISRLCSRIPTPPFPYIPNWSPTASAGSLLTLSLLFVHIDPACYRCMLILFTVLTYA